MKDLAIYVLSWNRPEFLSMTVTSIIEQLGGISYDLTIIDNGSDAKTRKVIESLPGKKCLLDHNKNVSGAYEYAVADDIHKTHRFILTSDHDLLYQEPFSTYLELLLKVRRCWATSGFNRPRFPSHHVETHMNREWLCKRRSCGGMLLMRSLDWHQARPYCSGVTYDTELLRRMPPGKYFFVLPGRTLHIGWRKGHSTREPNIEHADGDIYQGEIPPA